MTVIFSTSSIYPTDLHSQHILTNSRTYYFFNHYLITTTTTQHYTTQHNTTLPTRGPAGHPPDAGRDGDEELPEHPELAHPRPPRALRQGGLGCGCV